jgi:hypothetical protein
MRFPGSGASVSTGWASYSSDGDAERFQDEGRGTALLVSIDKPGAPPSIETVEVGKLRWVAENRDVTSRTLGEIISDLSNSDGHIPALTVLRLTLSGVVELDKHNRICTVLGDIIKRYCLGSSVHTDDLLISPGSEKLRELVGNGVASKVLQRLNDDSQSSDLAKRRVADHALKLLYRIAWEENSQ